MASSSISSENSAKSDTSGAPVVALTNVVKALFVGAGLSEDAAGAMAEAIVEADRHGVGSHGVAMTPMYIERIERGSVSAAESADVLHDQGATAVLDAGHMLGHLAADQAMALAVTKAKQFGVGAVSVRRAFHFGVAGRYASQAARANCIGIAMCNTKPMMTAPGGLKALVGNNPLAIAAPAEGGAPILLDMAMSEVALARVRAAARRGEAIPLGWAVGPDGAPTTDPQAAIAGMLSPIGGGKGFALALLIDVMCGVLAGGAWGDEVKPLYGDLSQPNNCAYFFIAVDVAHFRALGEFRTDAEALRGEVRRAPTREGAPSFAPGDERAALELAQRESVRVDPTALQQLISFAAARGVDVSMLTNNP